MKLLLTITKSVGMYDGYNQFYLEAFQPEYKDKQKFNNLKFEWRPGSKTWLLDGHIKATPEQILQHLQRKIDSQWHGSVSIITHEEIDNEMARQTEVV